MSVNKMRSWKSTEEEGEAIKLMEEKEVEVEVELIINGRRLASFCT